MIYGSFGSTGLEVSKIGFGAWAIGGNAMIGTTAIGWGPTDDEVSRKAIHAALDAGINFFDTADIYGLGHSENILSDALSGERDVLIASKVGNCAVDNAFTTNYTKNYILAACEASLTRLKRETIDYYQLHTARVEHLKQSECVEAMDQLKQEGKIRHWGLSLNTFEPEPEAQWMLEQGVGEGFQLVLNLLNGKSIPLMRQAGARGYAIIARMPLQFGLLSGKMPGNRRFDPDDHRHNRLDPALQKDVLAFLDNHVWPLCNQYECSPLQLALSYIAGFNEVSTIIPGMRTPAQVSENTEPLVVLSSTDHNYLEQLFHSAPGQAVWHELISRG